MNPTAHPGELVFQTSSYSKTNNCVEVADLPDGAAVRDSKHPEKGHLSLSGREWTALVSAVKASRL
ncbi:DUF397 domain-containing protein [Nocardiopsis gilva YIM 90087]|uniref:DUF397 domain-containing protein n=1 Tax=Nocardiopsis gilva YIM 90087 TaxID=1235441 RepID=A0A223S3M3_9ACTN|nr:DUF397 domain-containing protein [Nocardiopsis gilva]ASU82734.1 DUF397 domain-containing protein [Nocardiopsis gilva YIM 90087]